MLKRFEYNERNNDQQNDFIIPPYLFEKHKPRSVVKVPLCELNEKECLHFEKSLTVSPMTVII